MEIEKHLYAIPPTNGGCYEFPEGEGCTSTFLLKAVIHDPKFETSVHEAGEVPAKETNDDKHDVTTSNPVNFDTAGYLGTPEFITKVTEVADENPGVAADVTYVKGGHVTTPVDYGNVDITLIEDG